MFYFQSNYNLILTQFITFVFITDFEHSLGYKCGIPGNSHKSEIKPPLSNEKVFDNGVKVKYSCDYNDAPFLIGHNQRECVDGEWTQPIPKCATLYTGKHDYNYTSNGNAVNISLATAARISGIVVKVSSVDEINVVNIRNIPSPECFIANQTFKDKIPFHSPKRYTTLFHCPTKDINLNSHSIVDWILITFSEKFKNCELSSCPAILEFVELYEVITDQCFKPDVPAFGKIQPIKHTGASTAKVRYKYQCEDYFVMEEHKSSDIFCTSHEDWSIKKLPKCVPNITCGVGPMDELKATYNWLWSETEAVVGTVSTFECIDNLTKINGTAKRECNSEGQWSEELPKCIVIETTTAVTEETTQSVTSTASPSTQTIEYTTQTLTARPVELTTEIKPLPTQHIYTTLNTMALTVIPNPQFPRQTTDQTIGQSLGLIHFIFITFGIVLGILVTICVIYIINKKRQERQESVKQNTRQLLNQINGRSARDDIYFNHMNQALNDSQLSGTCFDDTYDTAGYIQIEAVESMKMNSFRKYDNFDPNSGRQQTKPLPKVPE